MYPPADLEQILHRIPWFLELDSIQLGRLAQIASICTIEAGETLFHEGDREDCIYILMEGQVVLEIEVPTRGLVPFFTAETLDIIGWSSLTPIVRQRTASSRATRRSQLIVFRSKLLEQLCEEDHNLGYVVMRRLANVVANRLLTTRVHLMNIIAQSAPQETHPEQRAR